MKKTILLLSVLLASASVDSQILTANTEAHFNTWTTSDLDGDGLAWEANDISTWGVTISTQGGCYTSKSWDGTAGPLNPDNLGISPAMDFSSFVDVDVSWKAGSPDGTASTFYEEYYDVYLVSSAAGVTAATPIFSETLPGGDQMYSHSVNSSVLAGASTVYLVFRHRNCFDEDVLVIDDVIVTGNVGTPCVMTLSASATGETTVGGNNGTATVTPSGGTAPYTYSWSPSGGTNATATGLAPGVYTVTVSDASIPACTESATVTVDALVCDLTASTSSTDVSTAGGSNGSANITAIDGTAPYSYSWSPTGGSASFATGLAIGTYTISITDASGCAISVIVVINDFGCNVTATASGTDETSYGANDGTGSVVASGGTTPYTYIWSPSGGSSSIATGLAPDTYTVIVLDALQCGATDIVTVKAAPFVSLTTIADAIEAKVYPNPAHDLLNISTDQKMTSLTIIGLDGKIFGSYQLNSNETSVNVSDLNAGMYFYQIQTENGNITRDSFIKQ